jgi:hypothetical protein
MREQWWTDFTPWPRPVGSVQRPKLAHGAQGDGVARACPRCGHCARDARGSACSSGSPTTPGQAWPTTQVRGGQGEGIRKLERGGDSPRRHGTSEEADDGGVAVVLPWWLSSDILQWWRRGPGAPVHGEEWGGGHKSGKNWVRWISPWRAVRGIALGNSSKAAMVFGAGSGQDTKEGTEESGACFSQGRNGAGKP